MQRTYQTRRHFDLVTFHSREYSSPQRDSGIGGVGRGGTAARKWGTWMASTVRGYHSHDVYESSSKNNANFFLTQELTVQPWTNTKTELLVRSTPRPGHKNGALPDRISSCPLEVVSSCRQYWNNEFLFHAGQYSDRTNSLLPTLLLASLVFGRHSSHKSVQRPEIFKCDTAKFSSTSARADLDGNFAAFGLSSRWRSPSP